jgi:hypothetical protein
MLTFAAAVVGVAVSVGCGDASVGEMPSPILTAPPRATMTTAAGVRQLGSANLERPYLTGAHSPIPGPEQFEFAGPELPPMPTAMVAAQERSSVVEPPSPKRIVGGSSPPVPATSGVEQWRPLVESIFPAFAVETVLRIAGCESDYPTDHNYNPRTGDDSVGLMQINLAGSMLDNRMAKLREFGYPVYDRDSAIAVHKEPYANFLMAHWISGGGQSFSAWTCR